MAMESQGIILVADIGGTNARFACFNRNSQQLLSRHNEAVADHADIYGAIDSARQSLTEFDAAQTVCIAIAGPVRDDWVQASNSGWAFSRKELQARYGWSTLMVINDFLAAAYGTFLLKPGDYRMIGGSTAPTWQDWPVAVIGPGTGLGVAALIPDNNADWRGIATEGGHARLAPGDQEELALLEVLHKQMGPVQREDVLSGRGLCNLHRAWTSLHGKPNSTITDPATITAAALRDGRSVEAQVLNTFCGILGTVAADVTLELAAWGGVYLAGGILPRIVDFFAASPFRERFESHPQFAEHLRPVATAVIVQDSLGLLGAAQYLQQAAGRTTG